MWYFFPEERNGAQSRKIEKTFTHKCKIIQEVGGHSIQHLKI